MILVLLAVSPFISSSAQTLVVNPGVAFTSISRNTACAFFYMRLREWADGTPVRVCVLTDHHPLHAEPAKRVHRTRNLMLSSDGPELYGNYHRNWGDLSAEVGLGYPLLDTNVEYTLLGRDRCGDLEGDNPVLVGRLMYEGPGGRIKAGISGVSVKLDFEPGIHDPPPPVLDAGYVGLDLYIVSFQYSTEKWSFTSEYSRQFVELNNLGALFPSDMIPEPEGYYL